MSKTWAGRVAPIALAALAIASWSTLAAPAKSNSRAHEPLPLSRTISIDGSPVAIDVKEPGRPVRLTFEAKAGQRVGIGITNYKLVPESASTLVLEVRDAADALVPLAGHMRCRAAGIEGAHPACDEEFTVARNGRHVLEIDTPFSASASFSIAMTNAAGGALAIGQPQSVDLKRAGQDARFTIELAEGQSILLDGREMDAQNGHPFALSVHGPDGKQVAATEAGAGMAASVPLSGPPGTYVIDLDPADGATGKFALTAKLEEGLKLDGPPVEFKASRPAELMRFGFAGTKGDGVSVAIDGLAHTPDIEGWTQVQILDPEGKLVESAVGCVARTPPGIAKAPCKIVVPALPASGRYTILVRSPQGTAASGRLLLSQVFAVGSLSVGKPVTVPALKPGQVARYTFEGTAGQKVKIGLTGLTLAPSQGFALLKLIGPDHNLLGTAGVFLKTGLGSVGPNQLGVSGTYIVLVDPGVAVSIASGQLALTTP